MSLTERDRMLVDNAFDAGWTASEQVAATLLLERLHDAWEAGFTACAHQHMAQQSNPDHAISRTNPYGADRPERGA